MRCGIITYFTLLLFSATSWAASAELTGIRLTSSAMTTRFIAILSAKTTHKVFTLNNPYRVVIDLSNTQLMTDLKQVSLTNTLLTALRSAPQADGGLRLVLELQKPQCVHDTVLSDDPDEGERLVIDINQPTCTNVLHGTSLTALEPKPSAPPVVADKPIAFVVKTKPTENKPQKQRDVIVVIDPGHGGKDPGASNTMGIQEKDVVLAIAQELQRQLQSQPGIKAVLTRKGDYYIGLRERLMIARKERGDIFVAVHADAFQNPYSIGSSVFALSARGASSEAARWIAEKENYSELGGVSLDDKNDLLRSVLIDLSQNYTISASLQLGGSVLSELGTFTRLHHGQVEQARFVVLKSPDIPSILVETGFLSNPEEAEKLHTASYQQRIAQALTQGIMHYFWQNPPPETQIAALRAKNKTLPSINVAAEDNVVTSASDVTG